MTGITVSGVAVEVRRPSHELHPLALATPGQARSTLIRSLRAAGYTWKAVARVMKCSEAACRADAKTPPVALPRLAARLADAG